MSAIHANKFTEKLYLLKGPGYLREFKIPYSDDATEKEYIYYQEGEKLISFRARPLPGCCGVLVVYYVRPASKIDNPQALFTATIKVILEAAKKAEYGCVQMSLLETSDEAISLLQNEGFENLFNPIRNGKTGNLIVVLGKDLDQPAKTDKKKFVVE